MSTVLQTNTLTKVYGKTAVVDHISLRLEKGDIYGLIGRNGAGKTTLMKMICGISVPTSGSYMFFGEENNKKTLARVGCLIENPALYPGMTVRDNLRFYNKLLGIADDSNIDDILEMVDLTSAQNKKTKHLSLGMKQRLGIAIALVGYPDVLILDEPINGLDPANIVAIRNMLLKLNHERGMTMMISSHILGELQKLATKYGIIDKGVLVEELTHEELLEKTRQAVNIEGTDTRAISVALEEMGLLNYKVMDNDRILVYCDTSLSGNINATLIKRGIDIQSVSVIRQDPEAYIVEKIGGADRD